MARAERLAAIAALEQARGSKVICCVTSSRDGLSADMSMDLTRLLVDHLDALPSPRVPQIDLVLHSQGGEIAVPWRMMTLLRERCERLAVIVPHLAYSAATLAALGADEIVMLPLAMLGPIDPIAANPFNPPDLHDEGNVIAISVEDVAGYVALVKEDIGITHEDEVIQAFNRLAERVHPLALGNVKRASQQSRMIARKLLALHMDNDTERHRIDPIVEMLSSRFYYHGHPINRLEARDDIGLKVTITSPDIERLIWDLYLKYEAEMCLTEAFNPVSEFLAGGVDPVIGTWTRHDLPEPNRLVFVESTACAHVFEQRSRILGILSPQGLLQVTTMTVRQGWIRE
jgi:hypothetical protein